MTETPLLAVHEIARSVFLYGVPSNSPSLAVHAIAEEATAPVSHVEVELPAGELLSISQVDGQRSVLLLLLGCPQSLLPSLSPCAARHLRPKDEGLTTNASSLRKESEKGKDKFSSKQNAALFRPVALQFYLLLCTYPDKRNGIWNQEEP